MASFPALSPGNRKSCGDLKKQKALRRLQAGFSATWQDPHSSAHGQVQASSPQVCSLKEGCSGRKKNRRRRRKRREDGREKKKSRRRERRRRAPVVAYTCNPSYSDRDQEDHGSKPAWANSL
jgi:hypothetical protein